MGMKATTVRFGEDLWAMLERESKRLGISAAQFVREATIMRVSMLAGSRGDPDAELMIADIAAQAKAKRADVSEVAQALAEPGRLAALQAAQLLDSPPDESVVRLTPPAGTADDAPAAGQTCLHRDRLFFKSYGE